MSHHLRHCRHHIEDGISSIEGENKKIFDTGEWITRTSTLDNIEF